MKRELFEVRAMHGSLGLRIQTGLPGPAKRTLHDREGHPEIRRKLAVGPIALMREKPGEHIDVTRLHHNVDRIVY